MNVVSTKYTQFLTTNNFGHKPFQQDCFEWCMKKEEQQEKGGGIVALEMGLGKTIVMLALMICNPKNQTLIVVPKSLLSQWKTILEKITPKLSILIYHNTYNRIKKLSNSDIQKYQIILTTYAHVSKEKKNLEKNKFLNTIHWSRVILDEAHHASHNKTGTYLGLNTLKSNMMWMMTGTPVQNKEKEMLNLLSLIESSTSASNSSNLKDMIYYRSKSNVGIQMPPLNESTIIVKSNSTAEEEFSKHIHSFVDYCNVRMKQPALQILEEEEDINPRIIAMKYFTLARQVCVYPPMLKNKMIQYKDHCDTSNRDDISNIHTTSVSKIDSIVNAISNRINNGCGKIILCYFYDEIDAIATRLKEHNHKSENGHQLRIVKFDGRQTKKKRDEMLTNPADILIGQIKICSEGLNLQEHYSEVYFTSPHFNPAVEQQAIARCWRIGQQKKVNVFRFINEYTKDQQQQQQYLEHTMDSYAEKIHEVKKEILTKFEEEVMRTPMQPPMQMKRTKPAKRILKIKRKKE